VRAVRGGGVEQPENTLRKLEIVAMRAFENKLNLTAERKNNFSSSEIRFTPCTAVQTLLEAHALAALFRPTMRICFRHPARASISYRNHPHCEPFFAGQQGTQSCRPRSNQATFPICPGVFLRKKHRGEHPKHNHLKKGRSTSAIAQ
jgi:hypothetical protein